MPCVGLTATPPWGVTDVMHTVPFVPCLSVRLVQMFACAVATAPNHAATAIAAISPHRIAPRTPTEPTPKSGTWATGYPHLLTPARSAVPPRASPERVGW